MLSTMLLPRPEETQTRLSLLYAPILRDLQAADRIFARELGSRYEFVQELVNHAVSLRGKQLRLCFSSRLKRVVL